MPALQRAGCRFRPRRPLDDGGPRRRRVGGARPEGVDQRRPRRRAGRSSWRAPIPTSPSTAASRSSCATCSSPGSRSARCARPTAPRTSTRCSSTVCACPTTCAWATRARAGRSPSWGCTPSARASARSCESPIDDVLAEWSTPSRALGDRRRPAATRRRCVDRGAAPRALERTQPRRAGPGRRDAARVAAEGRERRGEPTDQFAARRPDGAGRSGRVRLRRRATRRRCRGRPVAVDAGRTLARQLDRGRHRRDPAQHHRGAAPRASR